MFFCRVYTHTDQFFLMYVIGANITATSILLLTFTSIGFLILSGLDFLNFLFRLFS